MRHVRRHVLFNANGLNAYRPLGRLFAVTVHALRLGLGNLDACIAPAVNTALGLGVMRPTNRLDRSGFHIGDLVHGVMCVDQVLGCPAGQAFDPAQLAPRSDRCAADLLELANAPSRRPGFDPVRSRHAVIAVEVGIELEAVDVFCHVLGDIARCRAFACVNRFEVHAVR